MVWQRTSAASLAALILYSCGCAGTSERTADLSAPPAPRLAWKKPAASPSERSHTSHRIQDLVIPEHRFVSHSPELSLEGEDQLQRIAAILRDSPQNLVIESSSPTAALRVVSQRTPEESGKLDQERRQYVIQKLLSLGIPDAETRVVLEPTELD